MDSELRIRVRDRRKHLGKTQAELAEEAGVSLGTVQGFETGRSAPQPENLTRILRAVGVDLGDSPAAETRAMWPADVQVFLDMMGSYLQTLPDARRLSVIHDLTRFVFSGGVTLGDPQS